MKTLKIFTAIIVSSFAICGGYIGYELYGYEKKQHEVREFQKLALAGYQALNEGRNKDALESYKKAIEIYDEDVRSLNDLATLYKRTGDIEKAKEYYLKAYYVNGESFDALYNAALIEYMLGWYMESIRYTEELMRVDRKSQKYYKLLALNNYALNDKKTAFGYLRVIIDGGEAGDKILEPMLEEYLSLEEKPEAKYIVFEYEKTDDIESLNKLAERYEQGGFDMLALRTSQKILSLDENNDNAKKRAARLLFGHNSLVDAYEYAKEIKEHDARSLEIKGAGLHRMKRYDEAIEAYQASYDIEPKNDLLRAKAVCAYKLKDYEVLEYYVDRLTRENPRLAHRFIYALEVDSGMVNDFWDKYRYIALDRFYGAYCRLKKCEG